MGKYLRNFILCAVERLATLNKAFGFENPLSAKQMVAYVEAHLLGLVIIQPFLQLSYQLKSLPSL